MEINKKHINYVEFGKKNGKPMVLLHGWGQNIEMMRPVGEFFKNDYRVIIIDLPGHGNSDEPSYAYTIYDYVAIVHKMLKKLDVENPILIGHSFGGKISLVYSSMYEVDKLIVLGSPYKKAIKKLSLKVKVLKQLKKIPGMKIFEDVIKQNMGSTDYRNASPIMRQVLVNHVNLDVTDVLKNIKAPTLIIWGRKDEMVPVKDAIELEEQIPNAGLVIIENATHYAYLEQLSYVIKIINSLLKEE